MDAGRCAGIFAERPTERIAMSNPSAGNQRFCNYVYMYMSALLRYAIFMHSTCSHVNAHVHVCTMRLHVYTSLAYLSVCGYTRQPAQWHLSTVPKGLRFGIVFPLLNCSCFFKNLFTIVSSLLIQLYYVFYKNNWILVWIRYMYIYNWNYQNSHWTSLEHKSMTKFKVCRSY